MADEVVELVVYRIKPDAKAEYVDNAIERFRRMVMAFEGFQRYDFYEGCREQNLFMDFVVWDTLEHAEAAAKAVKAVKEIQKAPEYASYLEAFEKLEVFAHFKRLKSWSH